MQTCKNCEKKLITATMQNRTHVPLICSLCSVTSRMAKVCKHKDLTGDWLINKLKLISKVENKSIMIVGSSPYPENLAEQDSIDGVDRAINSSSQRTQEHVGPLWLVVFQDTCYWGRLYMFNCIILTCLFKNMHYRY